MIRAVRYRESLGISPAGNVRAYETHSAARTAGEFFDLHPGL